MISPSSVNLDWFSSDEALDLEPSKLVDQTYLQLTNALKALQLEYSENDLELCKVGDPCSCLRFLSFLKKSYEESVNRKIAPSAERMTITDLKDFKRAGENVVEPVQEPAKQTDHTPSEVNHFFIISRVLSRFYFDGH